MSKEKPINLYMGSDPAYRAGLAHKLVKSGVVDFCLADYNPRDDENHEVTGSIVTVSPGDGIQANYGGTAKLSEMPALSRYLLEAMSLYESTAISFGIRRTNFPMTSYEDERRMYHIHLRYWNYMLDKYKINALFFDSIPHTQHKYIIYALGKIKNIPMLIVEATSFGTIRLYGDDIHTIGEPIKDYYQKLIESGVPDERIELKGEIKAWYELYTKSLEEIKAAKNPWKDNFTKDKQKETREFLHKPYLGIKGYFRPQIITIRNFASSILSHHGMKYYKESEEYRRKYVLHSRLAKVYLSTSAVSLKKYNRIAVNADYTEKYIIFFPQQTPEGSTLPTAGVFSTQYLSVQLLARAAKRLGIWVYVKEHYVQPTREWTFYHDLSSIDNVKLIKTTESTYDLIYKAVAISTQTGTCILEGVLMGTPVLCVGNGYAYKGMPGVFEVNDEDEAFESLEFIENGYSIDKGELKKYFYAMQETSVPYDFVYADTDKTGKFDFERYEETQTHLYNMIRNFVKENKGLSE